MSDKRRPGERGVSESGVADKLKQIRERRAQRQKLLQEQAEAQASRAPRRAAPAGDDDGDEKTAAFMVDDMGDLLKDDPPPPRRPAPADDGDEKTAAFMVDDLGDLLKDDPPAPSRPSPPQHEGDGDERTAAINLADMGDLLDLDPPVAARAPEPADDERTAAISLDDMGSLLDEPADDPYDVPVQDESTMAVSLDDFEAHEAAHAEPAGDERTMMVDVDVAEEIMSGGGGRREPAPAPDPCQLVVVAGPDDGMVFELTRDKVLLGRGLDADLVINDASASRKHFHVVRTASGWKVVDLGSGNGTRVNGERISEIALEHGMRIECGTTTIEFRDPQVSHGSARAGSSDPTLMAMVDDAPEEADRTRIGDMAALEIDPDWEVRQARQRLAQEAGIQTTAAPIPDEMPVDAPPRARRKKKGGGGKMAAIIGGSVLLLGGGFVATDKFAGLGIIFEKDKPAETTGGTGGDPDSADKKPKVDEAAAEEAASLVEEALEAFKDKRWHEARKKFKEALAINPDADGADEGVLEAEDELKAWNAMVTSNTAVDEARFQDALDALDSIGRASTYYAEAQELRKQVRDDLVGQALAKARGFEASGDYEGAKAQVALAEKASPEDSDVLAMKEELARATSDDADLLATDEDDPAGPKPVRVAKKDFGPGFAKYGAGDFEGAIEFFQAISDERASRRDKTKAAAISSAIMKVMIAMGEATDALETNDLATADFNLRNAKKADGQVNGAQAARIRGKLATVYAKQATAALGKGNAAAAGRSARKALALDPNVDEAKTVLDAARSKAKGWVEEAKAIADTKPDRALDLIGRALKVLPKDDPDYKAAYQLLNTVASSDSDEE